MKHVVNHLRKDPVLAMALERITLVQILPSSDHFSDLCDAIISQQLSMKAGATIFGRFKKLFPKGIISPEKTIKLKDQQIRDTGVSWSKVAFIKDLAQKVTKKEILLETLKDLADHEVIATLTKIKGIGPWTAEMFLMFSLGREDIFSHGDVGLQRAIAKLYGKRNMKHIIENWSPYKTYACRVLWRSLEL